MVHVLEGTVKKGETLLFAPSSGQIQCKYPNGTEIHYKLDGAIKDVQEISRDLGKVKYKVVLKDENHFTIHTKEKTYERFIRAKKASEYSKDDYILKRLSADQAKERGKVMLSRFVFCAMVLGFVVFLVNVSDTSGPSTQRNIPQSNQSAMAEEQRKLMGFSVGAAWMMHQERSPIDDSMNIVLSRKSYATINDKFGRVINPIMHIRCKENKTDLVIEWDVYLGIGSTKMTTRLDSEKAITQTWNLGNDNKSVFARKPIAFVKSMMDNHVLLTRITPYGENSETVEFGLDGLADEITPLREACGW